MEIVVISVYDRAAAAYGRPVYVNHKGLAVRGFTDEVNRADPANDMNKHPADFDLYFIGTFNDQTGTFECPIKPELLVNGASVAERR